MSSPRPLAFAALSARDLHGAERQLHRVAFDRRRQEVHRRRADEAGHEEVAGVLVELPRCGELLQKAALEYGDPVAERHRLGLVVGDVDRGDAEPLLQPGDLGAHLSAELRVEVRQRLVEEERVGVAHDRATHRHPLALTTGQVARLALEVLVELQGLRGRPHLLVHRRLVRLGQPKRERDVLVDRQVRVERVVLEHHGEVAIARCQVVDLPVTDHHVARRDVLQAHDHPQERGLPAARRADEDHELPVLLRRCSRR